MSGRLLSILYVNLPANVNGNCSHALHVQVKRPVHRVQVKRPNAAC